MSLISSPSVFAADHQSKKKSFSLRWNIKQSGEVLCLTKPFD